MTRIRINRDERFPALLLSLAEHNHELRQFLETYNGADAVSPGTELDAYIDELGKARYAHPITGEEWYSPEEWFEVIE